MIWRALNWNNLLLLKCGFGDFFLLWIYFSAPRFQARLHKHCPIRYSESLPKCLSLSFFYWDLIVLGNCLLLLHPFPCSFNALDQVLKCLISQDRHQTAWSLAEIYLQPFCTLWLHKRAFIETEWKGANLCLLLLAIKSRHLIQIMAFFLHFFSLN